MDISIGPEKEPMSIIKQKYPSALLEDAVEAIGSLPGIGHRSALRLALHLLRQPSENVHHLTGSIDRLRDEVHYCRTCRMISDEEECSICRDHTRDRSTICVVESVRDVMSIENTGQYHGLYHVLGGIISPIGGIGPSDLTIKELVARISAVTSGGDYPALGASGADVSRGVSDQFPSAVSEGDVAVSRGAASPDSSVAAGPDEAGLRGVSDQFPSADSEADMAGSHGAASPDPSVAAGPDVAVSRGVSDQFPSADSEGDVAVSRGVSATDLEVILALGGDVEGETTAFYIYRQIAPFGVRVTTLARGLGFGDDLEYADELTLGRSIIARQPFAPTAG